MNNEMKIALVENVSNLERIVDTLRTQGSLKSVVEVFDKAISLANVVILNFANVGMEDVNRVKTLIHLSAVALDPENAKDIDKNLATLETLNKSIEMEFINKKFLIGKAPEKTI